MVYFRSSLVGVCGVFLALRKTLVFGFNPSKGLKQPFRLEQKPFSSVVSNPLVEKSRGGNTKMNAWPLTKDPKGMAPDYPLAFARIGITLASTFFTWYAQNQYSSVMASAAFTLICTMVFDKRVGQAAFCGTFAGMCSKSIISTWPLAISLGAVTSFLYEALIHYKNAYLGVGGRLGMTAFIATSIIAAASSVSTGFSLAPIAWDSLQKNAILSMAFWHAIGAVATIVLREASDDSAAADPVRASAVVGLAGALLLQDKTAALAVYGGSFVGMSLPSRLMYGLTKANPGEDRIPTLFSLLSTFAVAGALGGVIHGITNSFGWWLGGWGGKAGTCAFLGCLVYRGVRQTAEKVVSFVQ